MKGKIGLVVGLMVLIGLVSGGVMPELEVDSMTFPFASDYINISSNADFEEYGLNVCEGKNWTFIVQDSAIRSPQGYFGAGPVDLSNTVVKSVQRELEPVCSKCVCLDHTGAGIDILAVYTFNKVWIAEIDLIEALVYEDAPVVEHSAHRAVKQHDPFGQHIC